MQQTGVAGVGARGAGSGGAADGARRPGLVSALCTFKRGRVRALFKALGLLRAGVPCTEARRDQGCRPAAISRVRALALQAGEGRGQWRGLRAAGRTRRLCLRPGRATGRRNQAWPMSESRLTAAEVMLTDVGRPRLCEHDFPQLRIQSAPELWLKYLEQLSESRPCGWAVGGRRRAVSRGAAPAQ
ncbi:hypothetical protein NDU88_012452 [Pleurodeles waltl]|uniref:Uncharacterized protein n=1 Tax=Pleurodeles waltl TaxID=8319 RepID=A0AAV7R4L1_PLEWA|nr:hypothetical protein NDU88_012452 [Pleurodeles waltl]